MIPSGTGPGTITPLRSQLSQRESGGFVTRSRQCDVYTSVAMGPNWASIRSQSEFGRKGTIVNRLNFITSRFYKLGFFFLIFLISFNKEDREKKSSEPLLRLQPLILSNDSSPFFRIWQFILPSPTILHKYPWISLSYGHFFCKRQLHSSFCPCLQLMHTLKRLKLHHRVYSDAPSQLARPVPPKANGTA